MGGRLTPRQKIGATLGFSTLATGGAFGVDMMAGDASHSTTAVALNDLKQSSCVQMAQSPSAQARGAVLSDCRRALSEVNQLGLDEAIAQLESYRAMQESLINLYAAAQSGDDQSFVANANGFSNELLTWLERPEVQELAQGDDWVARALGVLGEMALLLPAAAGFVASAMQIYRQVNSSPEPVPSPARRTTQEPWPTGRHARRPPSPEEEWGPWPPVTPDVSKDVK